MKTNDHDPLAVAEHLMREMQESTRRQLHPAYRKYPLLFLFLLTFSVAAIFHGIDGFLDEFTFLKQTPVVLMALGVLGLFITGSLYKRLGKDKYE
jgi:hypothetical protein